MHRGVEKSKECTCELEVEEGKRAIPKRGWLVKAEGMRDRRS